MALTFNLFEYLPAKLLTLACKVQMFQVSVSHVSETSSSSQEVSGPLQQSLESLVWSPHSGSPGLCCLQVRHSLPHLHQPPLARGQAALPGAEPVRGAGGGGGGAAALLLHQLHVQDW